MNENIAVKVENVSKEFILPHEKTTSVKSGLLNAFKKNNRTSELQHVLKSISFEVERGDFLGIVGRNGSGKSTLLKIISQIYSPSKGKITINGKLIPFIELGVGFNPELSGKENVFLNGALLGFSRAEIEKKYDEIVEFAELEDFMDQKLKNYSSGMQVRLAFSVAIQAEGDILVLDEVLAVGDEAFQRKCDEYFQKIKQDKTKTVVLVTHNMESVRKYCNKAIFVKDGRVIISGNPDKVADEYMRENLKPEDDVKKQDDSTINKPWINAKIINSPVLKNTDTLKVEVNYKNTDTKAVYVKLVIQHSNANIMITNAKYHQNIITNDTQEHKIVFTLDLNSYNWGECRIVALLVDDEKTYNIADFGYNSELIFKIPQHTKFAGIMKTTGKLKLIK
jgi:ABC-2 type transport system ATP-binding protein